MSNIKEAEIDNDIPYDIFISHRQSNGGQLAMIIKLLLENKNPNLKIFLDVDDLNNIHNLEKNIENSENVLLLITEGVFEREFVQKELRKTLECKKNVFTVWDRDHCQEFPNKDKVPGDLSSILDIKSIIWNPEIKHRKVIVEDIYNNIKIKSDKEKFLDLINKKDNYKQILSSLYIKKYIKKIINYDISKLDFFNELNFTSTFEIKKKIEINCSINIIILSFFIISSDYVFKIIQNNNKKISIYLYKKLFQEDGIIYQKYELEKENEKTKLIISYCIDDNYIKNNNSIQTFTVFFDKIEDMILKTCNLIKYNEQFHNLKISSIDPGNKKLTNEINKLKEEICVLKEYKKTCEESGELTKINSIDKKIIKLYDRIKQYEFLVV